MGNTLKVQSGDTLYRIAQQHNTTVEALCKANHIKDPDKIPVGTTLVLPDSFKGAAPESKPAAADAHETLAKIRSKGGKKDSSQVATGVRQDDDGKIWAKVGGKEINVGESNAARGDWSKMPKVIGDGRYVVWPNITGDRGYEAEGQELKVYDAKTGKTSTVMQEYFYVQDVAAHKLPDGREAFIVSMADGGLGAPHLAIVDPQRGEVFRAERSSLLGLKGDQITIAKHDNEDQIEKPTGKQTLNLAKILSGPVITNPPDWPPPEPSVS